MKISYSITVCNENDETIRLIEFLHKNKRPEDEICVLLDKPKTTQYLLDNLYKFSSNNWITLKESAFKNDFSQWKNELNAMCKGDYIFNIDADEMPSENLIKYIPEIIEQNFEALVYAVPRINTVEGLTQEHIKKWGWNVTRLESQIAEKVFDLSEEKDIKEYELLKKYNLIIEEYKIS